MPRARRPKGEGSIYSLPDGAWRVQMVVNGRRRTKRCRTEREARQVRRQWLALLESGRDVEVRDQTLGHWLDYWLTNVKPHDGKVRVTTVDEYRAIADDKIIPALVDVGQGKTRLGDVPLRSLTAQHVRELHRWLREWPVKSPKGKLLRRGLSPTTINHVHGVLRNALGDAQRDRLVEVNVAALVRAPQAAAKHHDQPTRDEVHQILATPMSAREQARVMVALFTTLRQGEALALLWSDVHEDDTQIGPHLVVAAGVRRVTGVGMVRDNPKSLAGRRVVPLSPGTAGALRAWRAESGVGLVFGSARDCEKPASQQWDHRCWERVLQRAGVRDVPLHGARGYASTQLDSLGYSARLRADLLGHAQVSTTEQHYTRSIDAQRVQAVAELEAAALRENS